MKKIQLTCAHAIIKHLISQKILIDGKKIPLFPGAFGIFGHGNVACLGQALEENKKDLPTWRGHHEQNMALTGIAYARAKRRKQIFIATSSVGPGSTNLLTAAAVAMSNRLPILFLPGDTYANRMPDPVLQQVEHFNNLNCFFNLIIISSRSSNMMYPFLKKFFWIIKNFSLYNLRQ